MVKISEFHTHMALSWVKYVEHERPLRASECEFIVELAHSVGDTELALAYIKKAEAARHEDYVGQTLPA
jgi:hypothetical protein